MSIYFPVGVTAGAVLVIVFTLWRDTRKNGWNIFQTVGTAYFALGAVWLAWTFYLFNLFKLNHFL